MVKTLWMISGIIIILGCAGFCPSTVVPWFFLYVAFLKNSRSNPKKILTIWALRWRLGLCISHLRLQSGALCPLMPSLFHSGFPPWSRPYALISTMRVAGEIVEQQGRAGTLWGFWRAIKWMECSRMRQGSFTIWLQYILWNYAGLSITFEYGDYGPRRRSLENFRSPLTFEDSVSSHRVIGPSSLEWLWVSHQPGVHGLHMIAMVKSLCMQLLGKMNCISKTPPPPAGKKELATIYRNRSHLFRESRLEQS